MSNTESQRIFKHPVLDILSRVNASFAFPLYTLISLFIFSLNFWKFNTVPINAILFFVAGIFFWTFFEYTAHRYLFHITTHTPSRKRIQFVIHGIHHDQPNDKKRLIMPPVPYIVISTLLYGIAYLIMGNKAFAFMPGMFLGHVLYVSIHYLIHTPNPPKFLKNQLTHHSLHHYKYPNKCFGVSTSLWDRIFGTMPPN